MPEIYPYKTIPFRFEFNPRDFKCGIKQLIDTARRISFEEYGEYPWEWQFTIGRIQNNAELHFFESTVTIKNPDYVKC